ncbi:MAG: hypothetical protein JW750_08190 [Anaerolineaceae bacterium]|nr:hypothetical protein [Anaerolineaceae bacterium]
MDKYLYLSLIPEALIASMMPPDEFGSYYAVGTQKRSSGQALFFEIDPSFRSSEFNIEEGLNRCVPHEDGRAKASVYISIYRTLERVPMDVIKKLYLVTQDGRVLTLDAVAEIPKDEIDIHLYQEIAPVTPLVASNLDPVGFYQNIVVSDPLIKLPALAFVELKLGELAADPKHGAIGDLPYRNMDHIRTCLSDCRNNRFKHTKMVDRNTNGEFLYRTIKNGLFFGNQKKLLYFPMPDEATLKKEHYQWWRSARF